jgi:hypothetical protein
MLFKVRYYVYQPERKKKVGVVEKVIKKWITHTRIMWAHKRSHLR